MTDKQQSTPPQNGHVSSLIELTKHIFIGTGVFIVFAIPTIALDIFTQGIALIEFQRPSVAASVPAVSSAPSATVASQANPQVDSEAKPAPVRVSAPSQQAILYFKYFLLGIDIVGVGAYLLNSLWTFLRSLKWK